MRAALGLLVTALLTAALLVFPGEAQAAGVCTRGGAALAPLALFPGSFILRNSLTASNYTGTPFSFRLKIERGGFPFETTVQWYTYDRGYRRSMETGILRSGAVTEVQSWCGGRRAADWVGRVYSK